MKAPADRLAALLERAAGRSVAVPRALACAALDALRHGARAAAEREAALASTRWALENSQRDRNDLAAALDEADVREAALVRAVTDRAGALASVSPQAVRDCLLASRWFIGDPGRAMGPDVEAWRREGCVVHLPPAPDVEAWWEVARAVGGAEGLHATLVLARWLVAEARLARGKDGATG